MSFLTLDRVSHYYFSKQNYTKALENISFSLDKGEFVSILGPSGCGKSTILSIIAGIIKQTEGRVLLNDKDIRSAPFAVGYMLQQDYLFPWKTIINNVLIGPKIGENITKETKEKGRQLLSEVGLSDVTDAYPSSLSGGMRQRVSLVRTFMSDPNILLLDEPFSALDYLTKLKLEDLVSELLKKYKKTAVLVTHDIGEAISMSDRIFVMEANPGTIAHEFQVPIELRQERPFLVRRHPKYQRLFDKIWVEMNKNDSMLTHPKAVSTDNESTN